jgi:hypothetical protein
VNIARVHADDELAILLADRRVPQFSGLRQMHPGHLLYAMAAVTTSGRFEPASAAAMVWIAARSVSSDFASSRSRG